MRAIHLAVLAGLLSSAAPAAAQLSNRAIAVESGASAPLSGEDGARPLLALAAAAWLDGALDATARVSFADGPKTAGRAPVTTASGTVGLRASLLPDPVRPQLGLEIGWARVDGADWAEDRLALAATVGLEWFPARDLSAAARGALRAAGGALSMELTLGLAAYF
jgi:hypothetical protein